MIRELNISPYASTEKVAKGLIGVHLYRRVGDTTFRGIITETEAYLYPEDTASHSFRGLTKRTEPMFGPAGSIYVYLIYGMYYCLNIVTAGEGHPEAVLIRGLELTHPDKKIIDGPGKLCRELSINTELNGKPLGSDTGLWLEQGRMVNESEIIASPRVGIKVAEPWLSAPLRFLLTKDLTQ